MSEPPPPRIRVTLPGGGTIPGRLLRWRQGPDGAWWAEVAVYVPAGQVQRIDGEDYEGVPRETAGPQYVMATDTRQRPRTGEIHQADCWMLDDGAQWRRVTPMPAQDARGQLLIPSTGRCGACNPDP